MSEIQREVMEVDVVIVGGGAAGLSCAIHLQQQIKNHNEAVSSGKASGPVIPEQMIVVLEKGVEVGAHSFSGAVMNPSALKEMIPDYKEKGFPVDADVDWEAVYFLTQESSIRSPIVPPPFYNKGNHIVSLSKVNRWLGEYAAALGVNVFAGFSAVEALYENGKIVGVRTDDKGLDKEGKPKSNFQPGMIIKSKLTVFAEGTRGSLFKQVTEKLKLREGKNPEAFELGVKEIIQMPTGTVTPGKVIHTAGFPLHKSVGGTFIYTIPGDKIILGLCVYLDSKDPLLDPHRELQQLKTHPFIAKMIEGGKVVAYGGKTLPAGGYYSMPKLYHDGMMVCGDSASMVNVQKLKGIHLAMKSGMQVAEVALLAILANDFSSSVLKNYENKILEGEVGKELYRVRNFHQTLGKGFFGALPLIALQELSGGRGLCDKMKSHEDAKMTESTLDVWGPNPWAEADNQLPKPDGVIFFDKLSSVYLTGTMHDEHSPNHLLLGNAKICADVCAPKFHSPCNHFCPASVYEMVNDEAAAASAPGKKRLQINYTNCIHCKTCDIKCPFDNINWTVPEGGGGPKYTET